MNDTHLGKLLDSEYVSTEVSAGTVATMIKVTPVDAGKGAKEMSKLHQSKPPEDKDEAKPESRESSAPAGDARPAGPER